MEHLYIGHHWEPTFCPLYRGVPNSEAFTIFPVGMALRNCAVEHDVQCGCVLRVFLCCTLAGKATQGVSTMS